MTDVAISAKVTSEEIDGAKPGHWVIVGPGDRQERDFHALKKFRSTIQGGKLIGMLGGALIGAVLGGVAGGLIATIGTIIGCPAGALVGFSLGMCTGAILVGGGTLIVAAVEYFQTINTPFRPHLKYIPHKPRTKSARPS